MDKDKFTRSAIMGAKVGSKSHNKLVGIGSRVQDAIDAFLIMNEISSDDVGMN